jgi:prepilin-type N-terminal cleavage/methylation domain-containing protein
MNARGGFTLIEMAISLVLMTVLGGLFFLTTQSTTGAVRTGIAVAELDAEALRTLDRVCEDLKMSSPDLATPQSVVPFSGDQLDFQRGMGADVNGALQWGPVERFELVYDELDNGADDDGDGLVDEGRLVWTENPGVAGERSRVVCGGVSEYLEGETFDGEDENENGLIDERGFALVFEGNRVTVRLTLRSRDRNGQAIASTVQRTVAFRNEGD